MQNVLWIKCLWFQVEKDALKILQQGQVDLDYVPNYWIVVINCLLQRKIDTVRALLQINPDAHTEAFKLVDIILRTMPIFEVCIMHSMNFFLYHTNLWWVNQLQLYGGLTVTEFHYRHECWKKEAKKLLLDGNFETYKYLTMIVKVIITWMVHLDFFFDGR